MKLVLISDTHEMHEQVKIPPCDVLIHAGDLTGRGSPARTQMAIEWLDEQPAEHVIAIAGNHDFFFQDYPEAARDLLAQTRVRYLENSGVTIYGVKFWGSPWTPRFCDWAFMYDRSQGGPWQEIPDDTNVLITHGPPLGILDTASPGSERLGCYDLSRAARSLSKLKVHVFGHIHGGYGYAIGDYPSVPQFYNASIVNEDYRVANKPWEVELD